ncbi:MAG: Bax inhibitor-1 family protein, partial [Planctomycetaceae bacterium]|nr:Bax inhibitor-1 family protein [Planctomycetaceae bacterium]
ATIHSAYTELITTENRENLHKNITFFKAEIIKNGLTGADFSFMRGFLVVGSLVAFAALIFGAISGFHMGLWFSVAMIGLSAGYILYDTSNVMRHYRTDQHVAAALALFASVALMFWYMIQLLLALQGRD